MPWLQPRLDFVSLSVALTAEAAKPCYNASSVDARVGCNLDQGPNWAWSWIKVG